MTDVNCVEVERIGNVLEYPEDHPVRRHAETCPRCRTILASYQAFLRSEPGADAHLEEARTHLDAAIAGRARAVMPSQPQAPLRVTRAGWWGRLLRPMPALVGALIVVVATVLWMRTDRGVETPALRTDGNAGSVWRPNQPSAQPDGSVLLSWSAVEVADAYEIRVYGPALEILARLGPTADTSLVLDRSALPTDLPADSDLTWRVVAYRGGAELAASAPRSVHLR